MRASHAWLVTMQLQLALQIVATRQPTSLQKTISYKNQSLHKQNSTSKYPNTMDFFGWRYYVTR